ncbi:hypothetical protein NA57DRAFT_71680 [Rhizodiscina lignyota]|uniref:Uncharacterized protein n=1 Tax=Rhizodiscina lignyota TaxID=1504668 RepID=A0A9P4IMJ5_9PEZI|nr:hypothetical protein NA57DRAFT_71680 [Rhizodiscina lignyota]
MGFPEHVIYHETKRDASPFNAIRDKLSDFHYWFIVTFGLYVMTPGERLVCYLFTLAILSAVLWLSNQIFSYTVVALVRSLLESKQLPQLSVVGNIIVSPSVEAMEKAVVVATNALGRNASMAALP